MTTAAKSLVLAVCALLTMLALLWLSVPQKGSKTSATATPATTIEMSAESPAAPGATQSSKYFFDVVTHTAEEFHALLKRAYMIYEETPFKERSRLEVVMVLHGPDIEYFASANYAKHHEIVDLAAKLDAFGVYDFKVCAVAARSLGVEAGDVPAFVEFVPYGPDEIERLEKAGFVRL